MCLTPPECNGVISRAWVVNHDGTPMHVVTKKLKNCKKMLTTWNRDHFGSVLKKIKKLKERLWRAEVDSVQSSDVEEVNRLKKGLNKLCEQEEKMWQQRS